MASNYKPFIEILPEKADAWRNYCICNACKEVEGRSNAILKKFPNKTERIRTHLKKCQYFKNKFPEIYAEFFELETSRVENNEENSRKKLRRESTGSAYSSTSWASIYNLLIYLLKYLMILYRFYVLLKNLFCIGNLSTNSSNITIGLLDSFVTRPLAAHALSKSEEVIFERLMI